MKVPERRLYLGDAVLKCVGSAYKFGYHVAAATVGSSNGRAATS